MAGITNTRSLPSQARGQLRNSSSSLGIASGGLGGLGGFVPTDTPLEVPSEIQDQLLESNLEAEDTIRAQNEALEGTAIQGGIFGASRLDALTQQNILEGATDARQARTSILSDFLDNPEGSTEEAVLDSRAEDAARSTQPLGGFRSILGLV